MIGAFLSYFTSLQFFNMNPLGIAIVLIMILGYITVFQRVYHSWKELKSL